MKRGIVMSIHERHAVVMTADGQFLRAPLQGSPQIGEELVFEEEIPVKRRAGLSRVASRYAAAAAMFCLLTIAGIAYSIQTANPVVAYVTMDINPSVEIGVDGKERVRALRALNEDGAKLIENIDYKGKDVETVAAVILEQANQSHYLDAPHKDILITSIMLSGKKGFAVEFESILTDSLNKKLQQWLAEHTSELKDVTIMTLSVPEELREAADANGISSGKMAVYLMAKDEGYEGEISELKEVSIDKWTEPIGGVKQIVDDEDEAATKAKLQELLAKEKKEKEAQEKKPNGQTGAALQDGPTEKPAASPSAVPAVTPASKPTAKPSKPSDSKGNNGKKDRDDDDEDSDDDEDKKNSNNRNNGNNKNQGKDNKGSKNDNGHSSKNNGKNRNNGPSGKKDDDDRDDDDDGWERNRYNDRDNSWLNNRYAWDDRDDDDEDRRDDDRDDDDDDDDRDDENVDRKDNRNRDGKGGRDRD
ncbi:hypothetical protein D3P08_11865 [Paenibacillus nanensis]|uniref:RsgI N-terminal anti-sigma domain-containing protein n=1 Tax=Paenibacillus nanensis TaxID=393251 RepID=A0A3A1UWX8_9BACL|nr:anti-sigma factor domain-containing protein [Paenibacillus nanensis]RIX52705.1 hypothetical protein D3P08_11865 [Paenibacillus nanensis]